MTQENEINFNNILQFVWIIIFTYETRLISRPGSVAT
jgi:hypothetical protein